MEEVRTEKMKISIVIPVYNVEKFLPKCLDSVCAQGETVAEIVLVNDGSTDGSLQICKAYAKRDGRIKIIDQKNHGLSNAVRVGVRAASCEYIGFVDSDDYIEKDMFEKLAGAIVESGAEIAICDYDRIDEEGNCLGVTDLGIPHSCVLTKENGLFPYPIFPCIKKGTPDTYISGSRCNKLMKRDLLVNSFSFEDKGVSMGEDAALIIPIMMQCDKMVYLKEALYHYLQRGGSIAHRYKSTYLEDWRKIAENMKQAAADYNVEDLSACVIAWLFNICLLKIRSCENMNKKQKREEIKRIAQDGEVAAYLKSVKVKLKFKYAVYLSLLRRRFYGILSWL